MSAVNRPGVLLFAAACFALPLPVAAQQSAPTVEMIGASGEGQKYWPGWRGPTRQGIAADGDYPDAWSPTTNVVWKVELPGRGNSSPIVWADRLFLTAWDNGGRDRFILCLNRQDGKLLWRTPVPPATVEKTQRKNGFASGTPVTDGERVYAYFGNFGLVCVDFDGKLVWHRPIGPVNALHGMACSPLLYKDKVIIFQEDRNKDKGFIMAVDKRTGDIAWKKTRKEKVGWGSPIAIRVGNQDQIIVSSSLKVYAYDPADGRVLWTCKGNLYEVTPTPVVGHGLVFCCSGRRGPTLAIRPDGRGDVTGSHLRWKTIKGSPFIPSPLLYGDYLYMINDIISVVTCYHAESGKMMWQERLGEPTKHGFSASPIGVNGKVFFTSDAGDTYVLRAGPKFELLRVNRLHERTLASPALVDGKWYIRTERHLYCIGNKK